MIGPPERTTAYNPDGDTHVESVYCRGLRPRRNPDAGRWCPRNCRDRIRDLSLRASPGTRGSAETGTSWRKRLGAFGGWSIAVFICCRQCELLVEGKPWPSAGASGSANRRPSEDRTISSGNSEDADPRTSLLRGNSGSGLAGRFAVSEQMESQVISRRQLFLLVGLAASFAVPAAVLTVSNAQAQQPEAQQPSETPKKKKKKKKKTAPTGSAPAPSPSETPKAQ